MARLAALVLMLAGLANAAATALYDPTRPTDPSAYFGGAEKRPAGGWSLQSILSSDQRRIAIINGTAVREGDWIDNARVVRIHPSKVLLQSGGRRLTLRLLPDSIKVRP
jgi:MSHA biogenesis protein MshK